MLFNDRYRKKLMKEVKNNAEEAIEELDELPHNELQPIMDRLEGASDPFGDFAQGDDYDDDWIDE